MLFRSCVCTAVFFAGLVSSFLFQRTTDSEVLNAVCACFYAVFPNWQFFWLADAVAMKRHIPGGYVVMAAAYMGLFVVIAATWAVVLFQNKEVAGDTRN